MSNRESRRIQVFITTVATVYISTLLLWEHLHGGVVSHHILHRSDLPAISNWWGILLLPALTWFLAGRIGRREAGPWSRVVIVRLIGSLLFGVVLSIAFLKGFEIITSLMPPGLLVLAFFIPLFKAEYVLGFVLSMTFTFGAILPTVFAAIVALLAYVIFRFIRPVPVYLVSLFGRKMG